MKHFIKIDDNGFFIKIYTQEELDSCCLEDILKGWDSTGGLAAKGYNIDITGIHKIPSDCVYTEYPIPEGLQLSDGYASRWNGEQWEIVKIN